MTKINKPVHIQRYCITLQEQNQRIKYSLSLSDPWMMQVHPWIQATFRIDWCSQNGNQQLSSKDQSNQRMKSHNCEQRIVSCRRTAVQQHSSYTNSQSGFLILQTRREISVEIFSRVLCLAEKNKIEFMQNFQCQFVIVNCCFVVQKRRQVSQIPIRTFYLNTLYVIEGKIDLLAFSCDKWKPLGQKENKLLRVILHE